MRQFCKEQASAFDFTNDVGGKAPIVERASGPERLPSLKQYKWLTRITNSKRPGKSTEPTALRAP